MSTTQFIADSIDQLDLALEQLALRDRNFDRFALMLVDNVVELVLHKAAQDCAFMLGWTRINEEKAKAVKAALGQSFKDKVALARKAGAVSAIRCDSLLHLHSFRNTAYHEGLRHESILHSLTLFYFRAACELLAAYAPACWSSSSDDMMSLRAKKHLGDTVGSDIQRCASTACMRLADSAAAMDADLISALSADMLSVIDDVDELIGFLAHDGTTRSQAVRRVQSWGLAFTQQGMRFAEENGCTEKHIGPYVEWLANNYRWQISTDPIPKWRLRHNGLVEESDEDSALNKYCQFLKQTADFREEIVRSANALDAHIDEQVDRLRYE